MEDVFYILLGLAVLFLAAHHAFHDDAQNTFLEREVWDLRKRLSALGAM